MSELLELSARELSAKLAAREVSAVELMRATLDRVAAVNPAVNAIVSLRGTEALMAEAAAADAGPRTGWLQGIPVAVKDLVATAGLRTTWGSPLFARHVPEADDLLAARLKAAGAIVIGKTNVPEFGFGSHSYNPVHGVTRNPYDRARSAGGSSGGAGAALAARMVAVADGSDAMGSLRNPAAWNNVYSLRPSHGLVPGDPQGEMFLHPLATLGPMARDIADLAALLETMAGPDPRVPTGRVFEARGLTAGSAGRRIGWLGDWGGAWPVEDGILPLCEGALSVFEELGFAVDPVAPPFPAEALWQSWTTLRSWAAAGKQGTHYADPEARAQLKPEVIWEIERGLALPNADILQAGATRSEWFRAAAALFERFDALVLPSAQVWPFPADWHWPKEINGGPMDTYHRWMEAVVPVSLSGLPCLNLPAGFGAAGLPMGMQVFGPMGSDMRLLQLGQAYHTATDWPGRRPPPLD
ncbi:MAG: amidase [Rhodobacter sp.]|nr:amidase [Rhodobacter sp.]